jgi:hypothetical protein
MVPAKRQRDVKAGFGGALADRLGRGPDPREPLTVSGLPPRVGYPRSADVSDPTQPYVMFPGTPYEHLMLPVNAAK